MSKNSHSEQSMNGVNAVDFTKEEIKELKNTLASAIDDGYVTNEVTKKIAHKLFSVEEMKWLDENANIGIKLL